ncbi:DUF72 domain-containing protein [Paucibacter sp. PLA-PC-4]|uniref:DUF72 domain-containing protein n=1 Tax=Paucibacter sp. PLA-PC-4 TaxID=2993655 RepID=UPI0022497661|nr:DUF72 domain-containing protein [Paucibacter sp. PLA-PC-4]MCX2862919.1 DUF72 domain-containing protein [Paucibacter sp. PLA-PC-4]
MSTGIYVGIGGWNFEPWRQTFYPPGLPAARELEYASRQLSAIEVNGTYYSTFKPPTFAKWRDATPPGFVFALKANRFATNRRVLAEAGESVRRFVDSGIAELGPKLGPIVWQFAPAKRFDPVDFEAFLQLLPAQVGGLALRHALDVRHESFRTPEYLALARRYGASTVLTESDDYPAIADLTGGFVYSRIMRTESALPEGCPPATLDQLAACARRWGDGGQPSGLPLVEPASAPPAAPRDVFMFFISGAKERAPAAAQALIRRLA